MHRLTLLTAAALAVAPLFAQSHTIPNGTASAPGNTSNAFPWGTTASGFPGLRLQAIYDSANFTNAAINGPIRITRLKWRANETTSSWVGGTFTAASVAMSTAAVDYAAVTTNFATNHGPDLLTVYSGSVSYLAGTGNGAGVIAPVVVDLALQTPFIYNPANGDLVIDVDYPGGANFVANGAGTAVVPMDVQGAGSLSSRVFASSMYPVANGTTINHGPVVELEYTLIREISAPTVAMTTIDMDAVGPVGPTSLAAINAAGNPVPGTMLNITLSPSTAPNPGIYNTNTTEGRALGLTYPGGVGLSLIDPPAGQFTSFDASITLGQQSTEFGLGVGDWIGTMILDFYNGPSLVTSYETSVYNTAAIKYFQILQGSFNRVAIRASATVGNWVIPTLAVEISATLAEAERYGDGCYEVLGTKNEYFPTSPSFDLANSSMTLQYNGVNAYTARPGISAYVPPPATATALALTDDSTVTVTLAGPFRYPGGITNSLAVCSNAFISVAVGNGNGFTPSLTAFRNFSQTVWASWHDYNPASPGSGQVKFHETGTLSIVTWDAVYGFADPNPSTLQFQFDRSNGNVHFIWQNMSTGGNPHLVGFKCGSSQLPNPSIDISALLPATFQTRCDIEALSLNASARPVLGTSINLVTSAIPSNVAITVCRLTTSPTPPIELSLIGMPGCYQHVTLLGPDNVILFGNPTVTRTLTLPNNPALAGAQVFGQSVSLSAGVNPFGALSSNGLRLKVNIN